MDIRCRRVTALLVRIPNTVSYTHLDVYKRQEEVLAEASEVDANAYTAESYAALQAAVAEASDVYNNENATQEEVDAAVTSVQTAMDNLVAVDGTPAETPTEGNDTAGTQTGQESTTPKANAAKTGDFAPIAGMAALAIASGVRCV